MATDTTIQESRAMYRDVQERGSRNATIFGVFFFTAVFFDTWSDAVNGPSITGLILSTIHVTNYHAIFTLAVFLQVAFLIYGFSLLLRSEWQMTTAFHMQTILRDGWNTAKEERAKKNSPLEGQSKLFLIVSSLLLGCFVGSFFFAFHLSSILFQPLIAVVLAIAVGALLAWELVVILFVARHDIYVTVGLALAALALLIGWEEAPAQLVQVPTSGRILEMQFWEALMFSLILLGLWPVLTERDQEENILRIKISRETLPDPVTTVATFGEKALRPISVMFDAHAIRAVALYGTKGNSDLVLLNVNDRQLCLPLHGHSLELWNMGPLEAMAGSKSTITDSMNCFSINAELKVMSTTASFRAKEGLTLNPRVVEIASELIFNNAQLRDFLHQVGTKVFEDSVKACSEDIRKIKAQLEGIRTKLHLNATMPVPRNLTERFDPSAHAEVRQAQMHYVGTAHMEDVDRFQAKYDLAVENAATSVKAAESFWLRAVHAVFVDRIQIVNSSVSVSEHQIENLLQALGIEIGFNGFSTIGVAQKCESLIEGLRAEVVELSERKETRLQKTLDREEDRRHEREVEAIRNQPLRPKQLEEILDSRKSRGLPADQKDSPFDDEEPEQLN